MAGFELGADAGACLAAKVSSRSEIETVSLSVTVEVLFLRKTFKNENTRTESTASTDLTFSGHDTLSDETPEVRVSEGELVNSVRDAADEFAKRVALLHADVRQALDGVQLDTAKPLTSASYEQLAKSGLVVQLFLMPFRSLADYAAVSV